MESGVQRSLNRDLIKGLLILLVIADHNDFIRYFFKAEFRPLTLHVMGFFFLAMHSVGRNGSGASSMTDRAVRYGVPFLIFYSAYALMYHVLVMRGHAGDLQEIMLDVAAGAVIGSFAMVKMGAGAAFLWFLPAFFGFVLLVELLARLKGVWRTTALAALWSAHLTVGLIGAPLSGFVPLGLATAAYILPLAVLVGGMEKKIALLAPTRRWAVLFASISAATYAYLVRSRMNIEVGAVEVPALPKDWDIVLAQDVSVLAGFLALVLAARVAGSRFCFVSLLGRNSLLVYLLHPAIFFLLRLGTKLICPNFPAQDGPWIVQASLSIVFVAVTALLSLGLAKAIARTTWLAGLLMPRDARHWREAVTILRWGRRVRPRQP